ncbi:Protein of unknown function [Actinoplanes derwentensis]|uniref:DUF559 domain-containing protein n=2 Tax=Actinoplanes derwentensis TaxID=113562 RepID=A0A1H2CKL6_9ACTN|nr:Protein of unknown function [Actinoplanes derwentensis]
MLSGPNWRRILPDVYTHQHTELDHPAWCAAAMLALPDDTAIGGPSAAVLWGVTTLPPRTPVTVVSPRTSRLRPEPLLLTHYTTLAATDVTVRDGLRVTTPERTVFDLGRRHSHDETLAALDAMLHHGLLQEPALQRMLADRRKWPGAARLAELVKIADPLAESPMESRLRLVIIDSGLPPAVSQHPVRDVAGRFIGRVDFAWPEIRLAVEYEGDHHRDREQFRSDVGRFNALRMAGWTVLRFTADDVIRRPDETARTIGAALAETSHSVRLPRHR